MNREDRVTFELMERIPLEELSSEIAVIRNVEVTPEIEMIAEYSSYRIRGALIFTGEYEARKPDESSYPHLLDRSAYYNKRMVKQINHRIPVDISLPADRIDDNGVILEITSLDYDLAEPNHLIVTTELELQGVLNEEVKKNAYWDQATQYDYADRDEDTSHQQQYDQFTDEFSEEEERPREFLFEAHPIKEEQERDELIYSESETEDRKPNYENFHNPVEQEVNVPQEAIVSEELESRPHTEEIEMEQQEEQQGQEIRIEEDVYKDKIDEEEVPIVRPIEEREPEVKVTISNKNRPHEPDPVKVTEDRTETEQSKEEKEKVSRANTVGLLSKFLKNREDTMTQIQVCIVQPGETIAEIAQRYNLLEDEIREMNSLGYTSNLNGKVLKIPVRKVR